MKRHVIISLLLALLLCDVSYGNGHEIKIKINGWQDKDVILGHRFTSSLIPDDTIHVDQTGSGIFKGPDSYPEGMYFLYINGTICEFLLDKDQEFYLETDTVDLQGNLRFRGSELNEGWAGFQQKVGKINRERDALLKEKENASEERKKEIDEAMKALGKKFIDTKWEIINANEDNFLGVFLKATEEIKVPDPPKDENGNITDSLFQYKYYRKHFFDHMDVSDARLIRTPIYDEKIQRYIDKVVPQIPDTLIKEVDWLVQKSRADEQIFRYMLITLLNKFAKSEIMGMDAVYIHIADKYYIPESTWSTEETLKEMKETVDAQKGLVLGKVAPNVQLVHVPSEHFKQAANDTTVKKNVYVGSFFNIHDIKADYTVLYFWEASCGHCRKSSPKLHEMVEELKAMNVVVIACSMLGGVEGKIEWTDFINKHQMYNWVNAWNPYSFEYKEKYDLKTANQIYILDKDKKIIAKRISPEQVLEVINAYKKREN